MNHSEIYGLEKRTGYSGNNFYLIEVLLTYVKIVLQVSEGLSFKSKLKVVN
jgi:hypothetical protein